jgi:hypothetical protein
VSINYTAGGVGTIKSGCAITNSGVKIAARYCSELGLDKVKYLF